MARAVIGGKISARDLPLVSFDLLAAIGDELRREARAARKAAGGRDPKWWKRIPDDQPADGPCDRELFVAYGQALGKSREWCEGEYERQTKKGGY